jgi:hypothetical protein
MNRWTQPIAVLVSLISLPCARAQSTSTDPALPLPVHSLPTFSKLLKDVLLQHLPPVLHHESAKNWGQQASVPSLQGLKVVRVDRNHGNWQKTRAMSGPLVRNLELSVNELRIVDGETIQFKIFLALPTTVEYEQQTWQNGFKVFSSSARARLRIKLHLGLEARVKLDGKGAALPDVVIDFKVADAKVSYDNFVLENVIGVGGDTARLAGEAARSALRRWVPSVERHALDKGREAILKAGENREVRINLAKMVKLK